MKPGTFVRTAGEHYAGMVIQEKDGEVLVRSPWGMLRNTPDVWHKASECAEITPADALDELYRYSQMALRIAWDISNLAHYWLMGNSDRFITGRDPDGQREEIVSKNHF